MVGGGKRQARKAVRPGSSSRARREPTPPPPIPEIFPDLEPLPKVRVAKGAFLKYVEPRFVDVGSISDYFPEIPALIEHQGWTELLTKPHPFAAEACFDFFNNLGVAKDGRMFSTVKDVTFEITVRLFAAALGLEDAGATITSETFPAADKYRLITGLPHTGTEHIARLFSNSLPPVNRVLHHMISTMIYPKDGGRDQVTNPEKFPLYALLSNEKINLAQTIVDRVAKVALHPSRSAPYVGFLTKVLILLGLQFDPSEFSLHPARAAYDILAVKRMGYKMVRGIVTRDPKGKEVADSGPQDDQNEDNAPMDQDQEAVAPTENAPPVDAPRPSGFTPDQQAYLDALHESQRALINSQFQALHLYIDKEITRPTRARLADFNDDIEEIHRHFKIPPRSSASSESGSESGSGSESNEE